LLGAAITWFSLQNKWLELDYDNQNKHTLQQDKFDQLFLNIQSAQSAVRGYAGTGNVKFIRHFKNYIDTIQSDYDELKALQHRENSSLNPVLFSELDRLVTEKTEFMRRVKKLCDGNDCNAALELLATEKGIDLTDSILKINDAINAAMQKTRQHAKAVFTDKNSRNNNIAYAGILASMLLIIVVFYLLIKQINRVNKISAELKMQKEHFNVTLNSITEGLITTGKKGEIVYMNPAAEKLTGWNFEEVMHEALQKVYRVVNEETGKPFVNIVDRIISEKRPIELENNTILFRKNTEPIIISNTGSPLLDAAGKIAGAVLVFNDITEKKKNEDELKYNEKQFRDMIEHMPAAVYTCDEHGYIQTYNQAATVLWGREPRPGKDQWCGSWKIFNMDKTAMLPEECPMAIALKEARPVSGKELLVQRPDGSFRHVLPSPCPLFNAAGRLTGAVNMVIDVTDKIEREILIKKSEEKYRNFIAQASDVIVIFSFDGVIHEFNDIICDLSGYTREEFAKLRLNDILVGEMIMSMEKHEAILAGQHVTINRQFKCKDGKMVDMEIRPKLLDDGRVLAFGRDITERKRNEEKIKTANERFEILSKATSDTIWDWDIYNDTILYNNGIKEMFGYEMQHVQTRTDWWRDNIHPEDISAVTKTLENVFKNKDQNFKLEYRFRCADNTYKYIFDRAFVVYNANGTASRMIGAMQDVTRETEHEKKLAIAVIEAQEHEKRELGMELHDNVNQLLSASLLYLSMANRSTKKGIDVSASLTACTGYISDAIADIRNLSHRLTPYSNEEVSFKEMIAWLTEPMQKTNQFEITLKVDDFKITAINSAIQTNVYRIIQEQLNNIVKHARAKKVEIHVNLTGDDIKLVVADNGTGFDPELANEGIGMKNIKRRTEMLSGNLTLNTSPGNGCQLVIVLPLNQPGKTASNHKITGNKG
jgi:two-component system sensor histidine kinase UhpB